MKDYLTTRTMRGNTMSQSHRNTMLTILALRKIAGPSHGESTYLIKYLRAQLREATQ